MKRKFAKEEEYFLLRAAEDYVALEVIANKSFNNPGPTPPKAEFARALEFIAYLFKKYGKYLKCSTGAGAHPVNKSPEDLITWLQEQYDAGKYTDIHYGIWFELDKKVIPKEYIPEGYTD